MRSEIASPEFQPLSRRHLDAEGHVLIRRQLKRRYVLAFFQKLPPCLVGIEACASSHHWSRELQALGHAPERRSLRCSDRSGFRLNRTKRQRPQTVESDPKPK